MRRHESNTPPDDEKNRVHNGTVVRRKKHTASPRSGRIIYCCDGDGGKLLLPSSLLLNVADRSPSREQWRLTIEKKRSRFGRCNRLSAVKNIRASEPNRLIIFGSITRRDVVGIRYDRTGRKSSTVDRDSDNVCVIVCEPANWHMPNDVDVERIQTTEVNYNKQTLIDF